MKKLLCAFLAMALVILPVGGSMVAYAEDESIEYSYTELTESVEYEVTIEEPGEIVYFSFTPSESWSYTVYTEGECDTHLDLYDAEWNKLSHADYGDDRGEGLNALLDSSLTAGETYYYAVRLYSDADTGTFSIMLEKDLDEFVVAEDGSDNYLDELDGEELEFSGYGGRGIFYFNVRESGVYTITASADYDTYVCLYDSGWNTLIKSDPVVSGDSPVNASVSYLLEEGTEYILVTKFYSSETTGTITLDVLCESSTSSDESDEIMEEAEDAVSGADTVKPISERIKVELSGETEYEVAAEYTEGYMYYYFSYTAEESGYYKVWLSGDEGLGLRVYDTSENLLFTKYTYWDYPYITLKMEAGETYYYLAFSDFLGDFIIHAGSPDLSGTIGNAVSWSLEDTALTISGSGSMGDYISCMISDSAEEAPWESFAAYIEDIVIGSGVTNIGDCAFCSSFGYGNLKNVTVADTVTNVGYYAFVGCDDISVTFKGNAPSFDEYSFSGTTATVYYPDDDATWTDSVKQDYGGTITWVAYDVADDNNSSGDGSTTADNDTAGDDAVNESGTTGSTSLQTQKITVKKSQLTKTIHTKKLKKKNQTFKLKALTSGNGKITYKKTSGNKKIKVSKTGKVTVKKGLKKGKTYKVKVKITAAKTSTYKKATKTVTLKIKIK